MPEAMNGTVPSETLIDLPSQLRIRQRLGMVSSSHMFKEHTAPKIIQMGGHSVEPDDFVTDLEAIYRENPVNTSDELSETAMQQIPSIIQHLTGMAGLSGRIETRYREEAKLKREEVKLKEEAAAQAAIDEQAKLEEEARELLKVVISERTA